MIMRTLFALIYNKLQYLIDVFTVRKFIFVQIEGRNVNKMGKKILGELVTLVLLPFVKGARNWSRFM